MNQMEIKDKKLKKEIYNLRLEEVEIDLEIFKLEDEKSKIRKKIVNLINAKYPKRALKKDFLYFEPQKAQKIFLQMVD